jgi:hypothetical protein
MGVNVCCSFKRKKMGVEKNVWTERGKKEQEGD